MRHILTSFTAGLLVAAALAAAPTTAASAAPEAKVSVPDDATITLTGHGWGHGHGMSQYGALGAAKQGLTAAEIVGFYYPGTTLTTLKATVKVLITGDRDNTTVVLPRTGLMVRDLGAKTTIVLPDNGARRWRLAATTAGDSVLSFLTDRWRTFRVLEGDGQFAAKGRPITLVTPTGQVAYRGTLRSWRPTPNATTRNTVNILKLDSYLKGVVPREMPASWLPAAVQAQAIAARTYASYERANPLSATYQICDTTSCQVYGGYSAEDPRANQAITATAGQVLTYEGEPAFTQFSSSNGGWSSAGSAPYLAAAEDPYDEAAGTNPNHDWTTTLDARVVERRFPKLGNLQGITILSRDGNGEWGGRVGQLLLDGSDTDLFVSADTFRRVLGLRSTWFSLAATATP